MKELRLDDKLNFVEEPVEIMDREVKQLKQSRIPIVKVRWNSKRGPEFTWEREDQIRAKETITTRKYVRLSALSRGAGGETWQAWLKERGLAASTVAPSSVEKGLLNYMAVCGRREVADDRDISHRGVEHSTRLGISGIRWGWGDPLGSFEKPGGKGVAAAGPSVADMRWRQSDWKGLLVAGSERYGQLGKTKLSAISYSAGRTVTRTQSLFAYMSVRSSSGSLECGGKPR
ncbi:hypothetical protein Tco_1128255 [Tanacetum coccineum]